MEKYGPEKTDPGSVYCMVTESEKEFPAFVDDGQAPKIRNLLEDEGRSMDDQFSVPVCPLDPVTLIFVMFMLCPRPLTSCITKAPPGAQPPATFNPEKPVMEMEVEDDGLNIPIEYRTAATMTMISMAQPYVIMYSKADCDLVIC